MYVVALWIIKFAANLYTTALVFVYVSWHSKEGKAYGKIDGGWSLLSSFLSVILFLFPNQPKNLSFTVHMPIRLIPLLSLSYFLVPAPSLSFSSILTPRSLPSLPLLRSKVFSSQQHHCYCTRKHTPHFFFFAFTRFAYALKKMIVRSSVTSPTHPSLFSHSFILLLCSFFFSTAR